MTWYCSGSMLGDEVAHLLGDVVHVVLRQLGVDGQAQDFAGQPFRYRQRAWARAVLRVGRLQVRGEWVVDVAGDAALAEPRTKRSRQPYMRSRFARSATPGSRVRTAPPSPSAPRFLVG